MDGGFARAARGDHAREDGCPDAARGGSGLSGRPRSPAFLFLQGPPSPFAREVGARLAARGAKVLRINLCFSDWLWWHDRHARSYRGSLADWDAYLDRLIASEGITDIVYFGDRFPYHRVAQHVAARRGVRAISYEYGYLRPDWIALEPGGQSAWSRLPVAIERYRDVARDLPPPDLARRYRKGAIAESVGDVVHYLGNYLLWFLYPRFERDRIYAPLSEYLSYVPRLLRARLGRRRAARLVSCLTGSDRRYFVVPLQMQNDYQIRCNSPWIDQRDFLKVVLTSFAVSAPVETELVVKIHPLDNGLEDWAGFIAACAARLDLRGRVHVLDGGDLRALTAGAAGMVIVNSTSGIEALRAECPLKVMGAATFDLEGVTYQGDLDGFWSGAHAPSRADVDAFLVVLATYAHVRGDFYDRVGRRAAVEAMAARLLDADWDTIFERGPPRLDRARRMGIDVDA